MRRASTCLAVLGLAILGLTGVASAAPTVKLKAVAVPLKGYPHTGNIAGAGAALSVEYQITGTEYGGFPPPIIGVNFFLPTGSVLDSKGFPTCPESTIFEKKEPEACPKGSNISPLDSEGHAEGRVHGVVSFGKTRVQEEAELFAFFKPGGGLEFFTFGHTPTTLEIPSGGLYEQLKGAGGFGPKLKSKVPLVETVPGAPFASVESIKGVFGAAHPGPGGKKDPKHAVYYGRVPKTCPKGFLNLKTEVIFAENGEESKPETVTAEYHAPCPRGAKKSAKKKSAKKTHRAKHR
jgi:hypothetical protein